MFPLVASSVNEEFQPIKRTTITTAAGHTRGRTRAQLLSPLMCGFQMSETRDDRQRIVIVPGMGCTPVRECNWYAWLQEKLQNDGFAVTLEDMPDPHAARESIWVPFIRDTLKLDKQTVLVGHSSGCEAIMRIIEKHQVRGVVLVAACHTDLGDEGERESEYYNRPW